MTQQQEDYRQQQELRRIENRRNELLSLAAYYRERSRMEAIRFCSENIRIGTAVYLQRIKEINNDMDSALKEVQNGMKIEAVNGAAAIV